MKTNEVLILGLGADVNELCLFSGKMATGYVDIGDYECSPCLLMDLGSECRGEVLSVPEEWENKLYQLKLEAGIDVNKI